MKNNLSKVIRRFPLATSGYRSSDLVIVCLVQAKFLQGFGELCCGLLYRCTVGHLGGFVSLSLSKYSVGRYLIIIVNQDFDD